MGDAEMEMANLLKQIKDLTATVTDLKAELATTKSSVTTLSDKMSNLKKECLASDTDARRSLKDQADPCFGEMDAPVKTSGSDGRDDVLAIIVTLTALVFKVV